MKIFVALVSGLLFAIGLGVSGMTRPSKVLGFLDVSSTWDPSLAFVMIGGIAVYSVGYFFSRKRARPVFEEKFHVPQPAPVDRRLLLGAATFGVGWGLGGYCPGPGIVALPNAAGSTIAFVAAMLVAMSVFALVEARSRKLAVARTK